MRYQKDHRRSLSGGGSPIRWCVLRDLSGFHRSGGRIGRAAVYGIITSNAEQAQAVTARFDGVIRSVNKTIGDNVRKGDVLVTVEANESLKTYPIYSALNGVISQRNANIGEQTNGKTLLVVEDYSSVWVDLSVFPKDIAKLALGQTVRIKSTNHSSTGEGKIIFIGVLGILPPNTAKTSEAPVFASL